MCPKISVDYFFFENTKFFVSLMYLHESGLKTKGSNPHQPAWQTS